MAGLIRKFLQSIAYAGLKPEQRGAPPPRGAAHGLWTRLIQGPAPKDPLYLSNRTWPQKLRLGLLVSAPILIVLGVAAYTILTPPPRIDKPPSELTAAEIAARTAVLPKDFTLQQNTDLQIVEAAVDRSANPHQVTGILKNNTARRYRAAELAFDLTDEQGSQVGGASTSVGNVEPQATLQFRFPIAQRNARFVFVREVRGAL